MPITELLVHLFIPRLSNNHRSKILHLDAMFAYVLIFALFNFGLRTLRTSMPDILGYATDIHVEQLLSDTNAKRQATGLAPLSLNPQLSQAAALKAQDMFAKGYWAHNSPTGATPWDFVTGAGYRYVVAGENLAKNFSTSQAVVDAWMASPTHRENIVKPSYKEIGFAVVNGELNGEETTLVVQFFGTSTSGIASLPAPTKAPVLVEQAFAIEQPGAFLGVTKNPAINIPTMTRDIVFVFAGVLMGVLLLDAWIVSRRNIVRVAGHNIAHFFFLSAIVVIAMTTGRGVLLP